MRTASIRRRRSSSGRPALLMGVGILAPSLGVVAMALPAAPRPPAAPPGDGPAQHFVVLGSSLDAARAAVAAAGGRVVAPLPVVRGVDAQLSPAAARSLAAAGRFEVTPDVAMKALGSSYGSGRSGTATPGPDQPAQLARMHLGGLWSPTAGSGVGVAVIDTGVDPTPGLDAGRLVRSPDFSGGRDRFDGYGHGTFMAGLIAGNGIGGPGAVAGVAPGVTLVSVKVARSDGSTTIARLIEGIGWAVSHRSRYDIRVMSISFGAQLPVPAWADPLDAAVEAAWASGITVVAAAGNEGESQVTAPGDDPWVITAGAETTSGAYSSPTWSGSSPTKPDVLAPGVSVESLRAPGSVIDRAYPQARRGGLYFVGSGTSMATALAAGAAAILIEHHPDATPDDVKAALTSTEGAPLSGPAGQLDVAAADQATPSPAWWQKHPVVTGVPSSQAQVMPWATGTWTDSTWDNTTGPVSWAAITWPDQGWADMQWTGTPWTTMHWATMHWADTSWATMHWAGEGW